MVEITRQVPAEAVAEVAAQVAARLDMETQRIVTLLGGRVGPVTRAVLPDKANAIAEVFAEAGVHVEVVPAPESMSPEPMRQEPMSQAPSSVAPGSAAPASAAPTTPAPTIPAPQPGTPAPQPAGRAPVEPEPRPFHAGDAYEPEDEDEGAVASPSGWNPDDDWDREAADWSGLGRREGTPSGAGPITASHPDASHPDAGQREASQREASRDHGRRRTDRATPPSVPPLPAADQYDSENDSPEASGSGSAWKSADHDPDLEDEADRLGPRQPTAGPSVFSTSTRWVPSPHDEYGFDPDEVPLVPGASAGSRDEGPMTTAGRGAGARLEPKEPYVDYVHPPREGPKLRIFLMWGLIVSIAIFLLLQFVLADRVGGGRAASAYDAGLAAFRQGDFSAALRAWEPEAEDGNVAAQYYLGYMAQNGLGQPWSNSRAAGYYRRAAEAGLPEAQLALGDLYLRGMGVERDLERGAALYERAAHGGDPQGRFEYGRLLLHGTGVARDPGQALEQFEAAAAAGWGAAADYVVFAREAVVADPPAAAP